MIKINLIQKGASQKKAMMSAAVEIVIFSVILAVAAIGLFAYTGVLNSRINDINTRISREKEEQNRLKAVIDKVNELKKKAEVFERKVNIIQELKEKQTGPVNLMNAIVTSIPDNLLLTSVREQKGLIKLQGQASNTFAFANFARDLKATGVFQHVDIIKQQLQTRRDVSYDIYEFEIECRLK